MATDTMTKPKAEKKAEVPALLKALAKSKDAKEAHAIRTKLRARGHKGGLRTVKATK